MYLRVGKTLILNGEIRVPGSKSQSIRGIFMALLCEGESTLVNILDSDDIQDAINVCQTLETKISIDGDNLILKSNGLPLQSTVKNINTGNSGITTRFIMPLLGLRANFDQAIILDCNEQMRARPIQSLVDALRDLGLKIKYLNQHGKLPVSISGKLEGGITSVDGITSQFLSSLLVALPLAQENSEISVKNLHERPYVEMTVDWLKSQNIHYDHQLKNDYDIFKIKGNQRYKKFQANISGDFSSASYFIAAAVMQNGCVELIGLNIQDSQGDKRLISILQGMGANIVTTPTGLIIRGGNELKGLKIDASDIPDLLPTLAVIGTYVKGGLEITNVPQARIKETDRIHSMTEGLTALGARIDEHSDGMTIYESKLQGAQVKGYDDHRTVMALALAGMLAEGLTIIDTCEAINKTFPNFIELMQSLGAKMELSHASSL